MLIAAVCCEYLQTHISVVHIAHCCYLQSTIGDTGDLLDCHSDKDVPTHSVFVAKEIHNM
jgi:hypothetical protein